ncbi:uncharacterized protein LOC126680763 [Mercurialis annua]|uniref:uncharacterized protein LOC126680763 n=1 Tax=Mercurialis annua TaxID=3986 RepID=UPI002160053F|nr:uncharacterized protein LOC126680763 [Mercurialis annua]
MASGSFQAPQAPIFTGENYQIWSVKMKSYLKALSLWNVVESGKEPAPLPENPTMHQIKVYEEEAARKDRALTCIYSALSDAIFTSIMDCDTPKKAWDKLQSEFEGNERVKVVKLLNLKRRFEMLRMGDNESVRDYSNKVMEIVNQVRLLGEKFEDYKVVEKILISLPDKFESKISAIEESCDLKKLTIAECWRKPQVYGVAISNTR